ncbi:neprilysin-3-like [Gordionus sp. m RMFG-2023]|uniref:neprilysin-3-like n=1 Tax=Gordionus sp. m RMFG-2023 TaxID=3053472 RepID=UPI0031FD0D7F
MVKIINSGLKEDTFNDSINPCEDFYAFSCSIWQTKESVTSLESKSDQITQISNNMLHNYLMANDSYRLNSSFKQNAARYHQSCMKRFVLPNKIFTSNYNYVYKNIFAGDIWENVSQYLKAKKYDSIRRDMIDHINLNVKGCRVKSGKTIATALCFPFQRLLSQLGISSALINVGVVSMESNEFYISIKSGITSINYEQYSDPTNLGLYKKYVNKTLSHFLKLNPDEIDMVIELERNISQFIEIDKRMGDILGDKLLYVDDLNQRFPFMDWSVYLANIFSSYGLSSFNPQTIVLIKNIEYFERLQNLISSNRRNTHFFKAVNDYLMYSVLREWILFLPHKYQAFYNKVSDFVAHSEYNKPMRTYCFDQTEKFFPNAITSMYLEEVYNEEKVSLTGNIFKEMVKTFVSELKGIVWLDSFSRKALINKVEKIKFTTDQPKTIVDEDFAVEIDPLDFNKNIFTLTRLHYAQILNMTVNQKYNRYYKSDLMAYHHNADYDSGKNQIYICYQVIDSTIKSGNSIPFIYGTLGNSLAHEMFHSLDAFGIEHDENGVGEWLTPTTMQLIREKMKCIVHKYDSYLLNGKLRMKGHIQLSENIADIGSIKLAYQAMRAYLKYKNETTYIFGSKNITSDQVFFMAYAQEFCEQRSPDLQLDESDHSPGEIRVNAVLSEFESFLKSWNCSEQCRTQYSPHKCSLW